MAREIRAIQRHEVEGMQGGFPWCRPLDQWPTDLLDRARTSDALIDSPVLAAAVRKELSKR